jgi:hypothetical protein
MSEKLQAFFKELNSFTQKCNKEIMLKQKSKNEILEAFFGFRHQLEQKLDELHKLQEIYEEIESDLIIHGYIEIKEGKMVIK